MRHLVLVTTIVSSIGGLLFGYDIGVISGVFETPTFPGYFGMIGNTPQAQQIKGNIVALLQAGACLGALAANVYADKYGRQKSVIFSVLIFLLGSALQTGSKNLSMLLAGRFIGGWGVGACTMLVPMYIAELAPLNVRGRMGALWQLNIAVGMMTSFWINYGCLVGLPTGNVQWRLPLGLQLVPGASLLFGMLFLPESIRWLALRHRYDEAKRLLCDLRNLPESHPDLMFEFDQIITSVEIEKEHNKSIWNDLKKPHNLRRLALGCFMQIAQQWTGTNAICCVKVFFVLVSFFFLDKQSLGRRPLLLAGSFAKVIIFCVLGGMLYSIQKAINEGQPPPAAQGYVAMIMIYLFAVAFEFTWGPITWIVCSEIFSNVLRALCISITTSLNWAMNAIIGKITPLMIAQIAYGTFFFYGGCCAVMGIIVLLFLPETRGKTLEEMDEVFGSRRDSSVRLPP